MKSVCARDIRKALEKVIANSGVMADLRHRSFLESKSLLTVWTRAVTLGYIVTMTAAEEARYVESRRAVRSVLLAMLNEAATDESRDLTHEDGRPSVHDLAGRLDDIVFEIAYVKEHSGNLMTLSPAGAELLAQLEIA